MSGVSTLSVQLFDRTGHAALKVFFNFGGKPSPGMAEKFAALKERFRR
jgi:putative heme degradation protein